MKKIFFTVGPSQVYPTLEKHVRQALIDQVPSLSHRGNEFRRMYQRAENAVKELLSIPDGYVVFFLGSSIEAMERIIQNTVERTSFHFVDGAFSQKAASIAEDLKKEVLRTPAPEKEPFFIEKVTIPKRAETIFITENDTSTGLIFPHEYIYTLHDLYPEKLIAVDLVSSAPYSSLDFSKIDMAFFSGQKGFGLPAGMSIVVVSPRAVEKAKNLKSKKGDVGSYHSFHSLLTQRETWQTPETPNVLAIHLFDKVLEDMNEKGILSIRSDIDKKAKRLYEFFDNHPDFEPNITDTSFRSPSTLVIKTKKDARIIRESNLRKGIVIGEGYGTQRDTQIRVANFPSHTMRHVEKLLESLGKS